MFEGFAQARIPTDWGDVHAVHAGTGPALLLLHGFPQTHTAWHRIAPGLARRHTIVAADLPGYGDSAGPAPDPAHAAYSKRTMAAAMVQVMARFGFDRFAVAGHDRGGRVAYRMALDHPQRVARLAVLDIVPTLETVEMISRDMALANYHWFFLAQPHPLPERLIEGDPEFYLKHTIASWLGRSARLDPAALAEYSRCFRKPTVIRAACEDYRAGMTIDLEHDRDDRTAGKRIACPLLALWAEEGPDGRLFDPLAVWRRWGDRVVGGEIASGHFLMEEAADASLDALSRFFSGRPGTTG